MDLIAIVEHHGYAVVAAGMFLTAVGVPCLRRYCCWKRKIAAPLSSRAASRRGSKLEALELIPEGDIRKLPQFE
jgi:hypothetical protein